MPFSTASLFTFAPILYLYSMLNEDEIWKDVPGYDGFYQASTLGRVKSLDRFVSGKLGATRFVKGRILKPFYNRDGYLLVDLKDKTFSVHNVVLTTFDKPKPGGHCCLHQNDIKDDNRLVNIKWGTYSENTITAFKNGLYIPGRTGKHGKDNPQSKPVIQTDLNGNFIAEFESMVEAQKQTGFLQTTISSVCLGKRNSAYGFIWRLKHQQQSKTNPNPTP